MKYRAILIDPGNLNAERPLQIHSNSLAGVAGRGRKCLPDRGKANRDSDQEEQALVKSKVKDLVRAHLAGFHSRQRSREWRRQQYSAASSGDLPVSMAGRQFRKAAPTFETPRTHHVHTEIQEAI